MNKKMTVTMAVLAAALGAPLSASAANTATARIDTRTGVRVARASEPIQFSTAWNGASRVTVSLDGAPLLSASSATNGVIPLAMADWGTPGVHTLTHADGKSTLTAQFRVSQSDFSPLYMGAISTSVCAPCEWVTSDGCEWTVMPGGTNGVRSAAIPDGTNSWMETTVEGPGILSFDWRVSCENRYAYLQFLMDGTQKKRISAEKDWESLSYDIGEGTHTLRWNYAKAGADAVGEDAGFVRNVSWRPEVALSVASAHGAPSPSGVSTLHYGDAVSAVVDGAVPNGGTNYVCAGWAANGSAPSAGATNAVEFVIREDTALEWLWSTNYWTALSVEGPATAAFTNGWVEEGEEVEIAISPTVPYYSIALSGDCGGVALDGATLRFRADRAREFGIAVTEITKGSAVEDDLAAWRDYGAAAWYPQDAVSHDGVDALRSGVVEGKGESAVETTLVGPGTLSFWWKLDTEGANAGVDLIVDGEFYDGLDCDTDWTECELGLDEGRHTVRWEFWRAGSVAGGAAFLDEVSWSGWYPAPYHTVVTVEGPGSADFGEAWLADRTEVTVHVAPTVPYYTVALSGDVDGIALDGLAFSFEATRDRAITVTVTEATLATALDTASIEWSTGGDAEWYPQFAETADGVDAARSGAVSGKGASRVEATLVGPGTLSFKWKFEDDGLNAGVDLLVDEEWVDGLYGGEGWVECTCEIGEGEHVVAWEMWRPAGAEGAVAYLDQVDWSGDHAPNATATTPEPVPFAWLDRYGLGGTVESYESAALAQAANGVNAVWECYVAGLDPTDPDERLMAYIAFDGFGAPVITWEPDWSGAVGEARRMYTVEGRETLDDGDWETPPTANHRFFRVKAALPK